MCPSKNIELDSLFVLKTFWYIINILKMRWILLNNK